jgi:hypothetical protein
MDRNRSRVKGRAVEVDILEQGVGFVLSVGAVSLWLGPNAALDVLDTLAKAVAAEQGEQAARGEREQEPRRGAATSRATSRRRVFS